MGANGAGGMTRCDGGKVGLVTELNLLRPGQRGFEKSWIADSGWPPMIGQPALMDGDDDILSDPDRFTHLA
jgi:hypothetical protein